MPTTLLLPDLIREAADRSGLPDDSYKRLYHVALAIEMVKPEAVTALAELVADAEGKTWHDAYYRAQELSGLLSPLRALVTPPPEGER